MSAWRSSSFAALEYRNFRYLWAGQALWTRTETIGWAALALFVAAGAAVYFLTLLIVSSALRAQLRSWQKASARRDA